MQIREQVGLAGYTTLRIGGAARFFVEVRTEAELVEALAFARGRGLGVFVLGGGSNLLVPDAGFDGLVVRVAIGGEIGFQGGVLEVAAGVAWDALVLQVCERGLSGMECMAGIPGLVGGAPIQNIGAYGQEVAEVIQSVRAFDRMAGEFVTLSKAECGFGYRTSLFNTTARGRYVVTSVTFAIDPEARPRLGYADLRRHFGEGAAPTPLEVYHAVRKIRRKKGMLIVEGEQDCRSAGSFFKNPIVPGEVVARVAEVLGIAVEAVPRYPAGAGLVKLPAAWLLDQAGFHKGLVLGEAGISSRHTLALINRGSATYADMARLRGVIVAGVEERFGIRLEQEPVEP